MDTTLPSLDDVTAGKRIQAITNHEEYIDDYNMETTIAVDWCLNLAGFSLHQKMVYIYSANITDTLH